MSHRSMLSRLALTCLVAGSVAAPAESAVRIDPQHFVTEDVRAEAAAGGGSGAAEPAGPYHHPSLPGPPMWPERSTASTAQAAPLSGGGAGGDDLSVGLLIIAGALALGGGTAVVALAARSSARPAH